MRAVGIIRVSRTKGEGIVSLDEQRDRIQAACERDDMELVEVFPEPDVSGGAPLEKRPGLSRAVAMIEAGQADRLVVAYFDRLVRSISVQAEIVSRVEAAGGAILAVDVGQVTNGSAGQWLSGNVLGLVAEYQRRTTAERTAEAKRRAIARGVPTFDRIPPGYRRTSDRTLEPDPKTAPIVQEAFQLRARGATIKEVQAFLRENGIDRGFTGTQKCSARGSTSASCASVTSTTRPRTPHSSTVPCSVACKISSLPAGGRRSRTCCSPARESSAAGRAAHGWSWARPGRTAATIRCTAARRTVTAHGG